MADDRLPRQTYTTISEALWARLLRALPPGSSEADALRRRGRAGWDPDDVRVLPSVEWAAEQVRESRRRPGG